MASTWEQFEHDPRQQAHATLRASDADRDVVRRALSEAYAEGRLDRDELDTRTDQVEAARTLGDLPALVTDLVPATRPTASPAARRDEAVRSYEQQRRQALWQFLSVSLLCWVIWVATSFGSGGWDPYFPWPAFPTAAIGLNLGRTLFLRQELIEEEARRLEKKERKALEREQFKKQLPPPIGS